MLENEEYMIDEEEDFYHSQSASGQCLSSHKLIQFMQNPILYKMAIDGELPPSDASHFKFGSGFHAMLLEGDEVFKRKYFIGELVNPTTGRCFGSDTKKYKDWEKEIGRPIFNPQDGAKMNKMRDSVMNHPLVDKYNLFSGIGAPEKVMRGMFNNMYSQIRMDWTSGVIIADLKTCDDLDKFEYSAKKFWYDVQLGFYQGVFEAITGQRPTVYLVAVETLASHRTGVWLMDNEMLINRQVKIQAAIRQLMAYTQSNKFIDKYKNLKVLSF